MPQIGDQVFPLQNSLVQLKLPEARSIKHKPRRRAFSAGFENFAMAQNQQQNADADSTLYLHCANDSSFKVDNRIGPLVVTARALPEVKNSTEFSEACWRRRPRCRQCGQFDGEPFADDWTTWEEHHSDECARQYIENGIWVEHDEQYWISNDYRVAYTCAHCNNKKKGKTREKKIQQQKEWREKNPDEVAGQRKRRKEKRDQARAAQASASQTRQVMDGTHFSSLTDWQITTDKVPHALRKRREEYLASVRENQEQARVKQNTPAGQEAASQAQATWDPKKVKKPEKASSRAPQNVKTHQKTPLHATAANILANTVQNATSKSKTTESSTIRPKATVGTLTESKRNGTSQNKITKPTTELRPKPAS